MKKKVDKKNYSYELQEVLSYMTEILVNEFPTDVFTPEYLVVSILDTKKCHANLILDNYLMSDNMNEIREIYTSVLSNSSKPVINKDKADFDSDLNKILELAEVECNKTNGKQIGTEHVLLSILNIENGFRLYEIFKTVGIDYNFIFDKCRENKKSIKTPKKNFINNNGPSNTKMITLKSETSNGTKHPHSYVVKSEYIQKYTTNINRLVREGKVDDVIGRRNEIDQIIRVLARRKKNNAILIGNGGVGKSCIIHEIAKMIENGEVPTVLDGKEIISLNITDMVSGTHFRGMFEERMKGLLDDLNKSDHFILMIDDIHNSVKSGSKDKDTDISGMINSILTEGNIRVIGTTTYKEYRSTIENNPNLSHKFQTVKIEPNTKEETFEILKNNKRYYEDFHNVLYSDETLLKCIELSERYITTRSLPDSAFDVLDLAGSYVSLGDEDDEYSALRKRLSDIEKERDEILNNGDFEKIDSITIEENDVKRRINEYKRGEKKKEKKSVKPSDISNTVSKITNIPISKLSSSEKEKIANLDKTLKNEVIGQDDAIDSLCKVIKRNRVGLGSRSHVLGAFLAAGASGVGKSLIAKKLAENIFGDEKAIIRIDMSEYSEKSSVAKLHGSSPGYVGYDDGGILTNAIKNKPYSVVLLDEIEKADESIYNLFLQVFDEGRLTESNGNVVNCKNCIFIMTSNIGAKTAAEFGKGLGFTSDEVGNKKAILDKELKKKFAPEFLNRLDEVIYFNNLTDDNLKEIIKLELGKLNEKLSELKFELQYDDSVVNFIHSEAVKQKEYGARPIIRLIQNNIEDAITDLMLEQDFHPNYVFQATCVDGKIQIS